jgi:diguanylate cyclase (GGDEF)-like protein
VALSHSFAPALKHAIAPARALAAPAGGGRALPGRRPEVSVQPRSEHDVRIWSAIAMWLGGAGALVAVILLPGPGRHHAGELWLLVPWCLAVALFTFVVFRPVGDRALYVLTNLFSTLGALTVFLACLLSGGAASGVAELYFFPVIYDAYFFRARHMHAHLVLNSALALAPLLYAANASVDEFPGHLVVLLVAFWSISLVISRRKGRLLQAEARARSQALSDPLTGLPNLRSVRQRAGATPLEPGHAIFMIDLDDFKAANSRHGHLGADRLLCAVAERLLAVTGDFDLLARIGGDELLLLAAPRSAERLEALGAACQRAVRGAPTAAELGGPPLSATIGTARHPENGGTLDELLACADRRLLAGKAARVAAAPAACAARPGDPTNSAGDTPRAAVRGGAATAGAAAPLAPGAPQAAHVRRAPRRRAASGRSRRGDECLTAGLAWAGGGLLTGIVAILPGAHDLHPQALGALVALGVLAGAATLVLAPAADSAVYLVATLAGVLLMFPGVYLTGGTSSPLLPLVFLAVAFAAYFLTPAGTVAVLLAAIAACVAPLAYASPEARLAYVVRLVVLVTTATVLAGIIAYNTRQLEAAERHALGLAERDPLTGLLNRRAFFARLEGELARAGAGMVDRLAVAMIDLDNFKRVNDRHGHAAGDRVLRAVAEALRSLVPRGCCIARMGGDELALIATEAHAASSSTLADRCITAVERAARDAGYPDCEVSATVGLAGFPHDAARLDALLHAADDALMRAKRTGKRRVVQAAAPPGAS